MAIRSLSDTLAVCLSITVCSSIFVCCPRRLRLRFGSGLRVSLGVAVVQGYGFCEWADPSVTDAAVEGLNGMALLGKTLTIRRAVPGSGSGAGSTSHGVSNVV